MSPSQTERLVFLSTKLRPIEEAQKMRNLDLKDFPQEIDYITDLPQRFPTRIEAEREASAPMQSCAPFEISTLYLL